MRKDIWRIRQAIRGLNMVQFKYDWVSDKISCSFDVWDIWKKYKKEGFKEILKDLDIDYI